MNVRKVRSDDRLKILAFYQTNAFQNPEKVLADLETQDFFFAFNEEEIQASYSQSEIKDSLIIHHLVFLTENALSSCILEWTKDNERIRIEDSPSSFLPVLKKLGFIESESGTLTLQRDFSYVLSLWYRLHRRVFPWRENVQPYRVWISEVMLQQTRASTVIPYYERFLKAFPTIADLANAKEDVYLKLWEGLGYYSRVRNLHKGACYLVEHHKGEMPMEEEELLKIPGIGLYTARAIQSIAFKKKTVAVDGNLLRVFSRLTEYPYDIKTGRAQKDCFDYFYPLLNCDSGDFNQALMDLGELVCLPHTSPDCSFCPLSSYCSSYLHQTQLAYPISEKRSKKKSLDVTVFVVSYQNCYWIEKRGPSGLLASLYQFPNVEKKMTRSEALDYLQSRGFAVRSLKKGIFSTHVFSHRIWNMQSYEAELLVSPSPALSLVSLDDIEKFYPLPSAFSPFLERIRAAKKPS